MIKTTDRRGAAARQVRRWYAAPTFALVLALPPAGARPVATIAAYDIYAEPGRLVRLPDGRRINLRCGGTGKTTVVFESGLGFPSYSWRKVQPSVERKTRACSYDRAGLGFSDPGPLPRSAGAIANDLAAALTAAGERPPYLLVANSFGSQPARLFAFRHPAQVVAMLLIDPYVEGQNVAFDRIERLPPDRRVREQAAVRTCLRLLLAKLTERAAVRRQCIDAPDPAFSPRLRAVVQRQRMAAGMARAAASELTALETISERQVSAETRSLGSMPLLVLTAGAAFDGNSNAPALLAELRRLHRSLTRLSSRSEERLVPKAGHVIQSSDPASVISAVDELLRH